MAASDPHIISRAQWGANPLVTPAGSIPMPSKELWLHHSAGEQFGDAGMRMLQSFTLHRPDASYVDLEYTFCVDHVNCNVYESRGPGKNSAATGGHNSISHAICVMGNFQTDEPSDALVHALANLVAWGFEHGWWPLGFTGGHRDASGNSTACPGEHLEAKLPAINALAVSIHNGSVTRPAPKPPVWKVTPMYNPPIDVLGGIAASLSLDGGTLLIGPLGHLYALDGARNLGGPIDAKGNVKPYFAGKQVAKLERANTQETAAGKVYTVIAVDASRYSYPE